MAGEIIVVPAFGQGHLLPCMELCKQLTSRNFNTTLVIFSDRYSSLPSSFLQNTRVKVAQVPATTPSPSDPRQRMQNDRNQLVVAIQNLLSTSVTPPLCAILDALLIMDWTSHIFKKLHVPTISFFTSGGCSTAMELATWKSQLEDIKPGEVRSLPGLPEEMSLTFLEAKRREGGRGGGGGGRGGPPKPGQRPSWVDGVESSIGMMINTCDDLERPYIDYLSNQIGKPVWAVGPLLPENYWKSSTGSFLHDHETRSNRESNVKEDDLIQWLDSKPRGSVLYVSFGSGLSPSSEECQELSDALEESTTPFIWVIQPSSGYIPHEKLGAKGLIIQGWAPQLLILSHPSIGGFLSHCGWNSTVEAIVRGVPFLAWPIRGDQYYDAKLVVSHLKVGYMVCDDMSTLVTKHDITKGIDKLMRDEEMKLRAAQLQTKFQFGFPESSIAALHAFRDFINRLEY